MNKKEKIYLGAHSKKTKFEHYPIKDQVLELLWDQDLKCPTLVQAESFPITLQNNLKNLCVIVYAYNGAGKTLTYLIPILNSLQNIPCVGLKNTKTGESKVCRPQAIIVLPTETLLGQVAEYLSCYADFYQFHYKWNLDIATICGGALSRNGHIIVALSVKLQSLLDGGSLDLAELKWVVFDECDKIKQDNLLKFEQLLRMFSNSQYSPNFLITSATGEKASFRRFIQDNLASHNVVELDSKEENVGLQGVTHFFASQTDKDNILFNLLAKLSSLQNKTQCIIFFNQIHELRTFYSKLRYEKKRFVVNDNTASEKGKNNLMVGYVHGRCGNHLTQDHIHPDDCEISKRQRVTQLRNKEVQVLLGTDIIGRGIDIRTVSLVINYSEPEKNKELSPVAYIHRVGRTGRYSDEGISLTFLRDSGIFIKLTEEDQKIKFIPMISEDDIIQKARECAGNNEARAEQSDSNN